MRSCGGEAFPIKLFGSSSPVPVKGRCWWLSDTKRMMVFLGDGGADENAGAVGVSVDQTVCGMVSEEVLEVASVRERPGVGGEGLRSQPSHFSRSLAKVPGWRRLGLESSSGF